MRLKIALSLIGLPTTSLGRSAHRVRQGTAPAPQFRHPLRSSQVERMCHQDNVHNHLASGAVRTDSFHERSIDREIAHVKLFQYGKTRMARPEVVDCTSMPRARMPLMIVGTDASSRKPCSVASTISWLGGAPLAVSNLWRASSVDDDRRSSAERLIANLKVRSSGGAGGDQRHLREQALSDEFDYATILRNGDEQIGRTISP